MRSKPVSITELPVSPEQEQRSRLIKYMIAMTIRVICIALCLVVQGWWLILPVIGAVVLPYFAVVVANAGPARKVAPVDRPGSIVRVEPRDPLP